MDKALIVIDMQFDFVRGALKNAAAEAVVKNVVERINRAKADGEWIAYTLDTHGEDYLRTQEGARLPVPHCVKGTEGHALICEVAKALPPNAVAFEKDTFGSVVLAELLPSSIKHVELIGVCTDICVISNAMLIKAHRPDVAVAVNAACCAGVTLEGHKTALDAMRNCQVDIIHGNE